MRPIVLITRKSSAVSIVIAVILAAGPGVAQNGELTIIGNTTGVLTAPPTLLYNSASIDGATTNGLFVLDAFPRPPRNVNNLGSFTLSAQPENFEGAFFLSVQINFPDGILGGNTRTFPASLFLDVDGNLLIDVDNTPQLFSFSNESGSGVFSLTVDDLLFVFGPSGSGFKAAVAQTLVNRVNCPSTPCTAALTATIGVVPQPPPGPVCTPTITVTEGDLAAGGISEFAVTSGSGTITIDPNNSGTGLQSLTVNNATTTNAVVNIPAFTIGTRNPVVVTFTVIDRNSTVNIDLRAASTFHAANIRARCP